MGSQIRERNDHFPCLLNHSIFGALLGCLKMRESFQIGKTFFLSDMCLGMREFRLVLSLSGKTTLSMHRLGSAYSSRVQKIVLSFVTGHCNFLFLIYDITIKTLKIAL